ncbi:MAG: hypothetical protein R3F34_12215 [Planctomycetota bacterium]
MTTDTTFTDTGRRSTPTTIERIGFVVVALTVFGAMFAPMIAIFVYGVALAEQGNLPAGEVTVGIAVVLRATMRRLLRGASTSIMRTSASALGRTSARTLTRRLVKFSGRLFFGSVVKQAADEVEASPIAPVTRLSQIVAVALGYASLCLSFWGVLWVVEGHTEQSITEHYDLGAIDMALLAGLPLLAYAGIHQLLGRFLGVRTRYRTEFDGLLLQAYFTGAGSFLPLTTDVEFVGDERGRRLMSTASILGLFLVHAALSVAGSGVASPHLDFLGAMFLVYCFVYCFPLKPLDGHAIWAHSKLQWLLVTLPVLVSFVTLLPAAFGEIM